MDRRLAILGLISVLLLSLAHAEKVGQCNRVKREQCQCTPHGNDDCSDECSEDFDCYGQRKCCTIICKRVCVLPPHRPSSSHRCPPDHTFDQCPPTFDPTCPAPPTDLPPIGLPPPPPPSGNVTGCHPRCVCRPGYVKGENGKCIKYTQCPPPPPPREPVCPGIHEIYHACHRGCQGSCRNPSGEGCVVTACVRGCFCAPGFVRNTFGRCIRPSACPQPIVKSAPPPTQPRCPADQEFNSCRRECEATCTNKQPRGCYRRCQAGCFCRSPLVRDHYGVCVHPDSCVKATTVAPVCNENEQYQFCNTKCQGTCSNPSGENCYARCQTGCFCIDGYVRDENGECIRYEECPPPTPVPPPPTAGTPICENDYEEHIDCFRGCQRTCDDSTGQNCAQNDECQSGCFCRAGLVRNHRGNCVPHHQCESLGCGYHEHYEECGPSCPSTCNQTQTSNSVIQDPSTSSRCDSRCHAGCFCDDGYVRGSNGCVSAEYCRGSSQTSSFHCGAFEDAVPCGGLCESECTGGWSVQSCPPTCRRRCCRRRFVR